MTMRKVNRMMSEVLFNERGGLRWQKNRMHEHSLFLLYYIVHTPNNNVFFFAVV